MDLVIALPSDCETGICFFEVDVLRIAVARHAGGEVIGGIEQPCIAGFGLEQHQWADSHKPTVALGGAVLNVFDLFGQAKIFARYCRLALPPFDRSACHWCFSFWV